ncbi:MAG: BMC domain-containing protein [Verrucomicrobiae bacterium]|nr:BMC domain-containing protein [Verrucomicrobiae bacterium]
MAQQALGMIETRGLVSLVEATDSMLKSANVKLVGYQQVGNAMVTSVVTGDVAAVKAAVEAGRTAAQAVGGEIISTSVIARPHDEITGVLPKAK